MEIRTLFDIFREESLPVEVRIRLINRFGTAINNELASNITEPIVYELVKQLDPDHDILKTEMMQKFGNPTHTTKEDS